MNHAITLGGLLAALGLLGGLVTLAFGALMIFAGGMSDAPLDGDATSKHGCIVAAVGLAVLALSLWELF